MRPEVILGLVACHVPLARRWRCLVCSELVHAVAPSVEQLVAVHTLGHTLRTWRRNAVRPPPRPRVVSWRRRLHDMEEAILVTL